MRKLLLWHHKINASGRVLVCFGEELIKFHYGCHMFMRVLMEEASRKFFSYFHQIAFSTSAEIHRRAILESVTWMQQLPDFSQAHLFSSRQGIQKHALKLIKENSRNSKVGLILEFGVFTGTSLRLWGNNLEQTVYGFDSFEGLEETFGGFDSSTKFLRRGRKPIRIGRNSQLVIGRVEKTLEPFLANQPLGDEGQVLFCHFDMDVYEPTKFVLDKILDRFRPGTLLLFDEFFGNPNWQYSEFKALTETIEIDRIAWMAFGPNQALLRIIK